MHWKSNTFTFSGGVHEQKGDSEGAAGDLKTVTEQVHFQVFFAGAPFYLGHSRPRTVSRAWSDLLQGLTWWGWRLEKFLLGKSPHPPRCYPCLRYNRWGQLPQGWSESTAFSSKASFTFVFCCQQFQIISTTTMSTIPKGAELGEGAEKDAGLWHQSCHCWQQGKNEQKKTLCI